MRCRSDSATLFFNDTATTEIYARSLHDALPIFSGFLLGYVAVLPLVGRIADLRGRLPVLVGSLLVFGVGSLVTADRKSTRLNSSHANISYAVFCLQKHTTTRRNHLVAPRVRAVT